MREIEVFSETRRLKVDKAALRRAVAAWDAAWKPKNKGVLALAFVSHARLAQLHGEFCDDASPTDIITFPSIEEGNLGELCISPRAALEWIKTNGGGFNAEMVRYVAHGYLHLLGYDDRTPKARLQMKRQETKALKLAPRGLIFTLKAASAK